MHPYELLSSEQVARVHEASLTIMAEVGLDFRHPEALAVLKKGGAKVDGHRVFFPGALVENQRVKPPQRFILHARNPENDVEFGCGQSLYAPANCPAFVTEADGMRRLGTLADYENFVKLTQASENLDLCSNMPVEPSEIAPELRVAETTYACLRYSDKCFMGSSMGEVGAEQTLQMVSIAFGDADDAFFEPRVISIPCSLTPLAYDERMLGAMIAYARAGQPMIVNSLASAGATAPATLAGMLALQNAEILAGIVLVQMIREGTPVVYGSGSSSADMRSGMLSVGAPEMAINNVMVAQMARFYEIPCRAVGTLTDAKGIDVQAGYESMMNLLAAQSAGVDFILHAVGSLETINSISYEKFVIDEEMVGMVRRIGRGVNVDDETLALEVIRQAGPCGQFLDKDHTFEHFERELFFPRLGNRDSYARWREKGAAPLQEAAGQRWRQILEEYQPPDFPKSTIDDLRRWMEALSGGGKNRNAPVPQTA
jgi:trimethylamine--corrinoid protein Co-methyltransferase